MADKANASTAIPQLLRLLALEGAIVPREAMGCQKERAQTMLAQGAADVLALQDHHPTLPGEGQRFVADGKAQRFDHVTAARPTPVDADHGGLATRP
jgi:predicted transposase YbfD/YdcC